MQRSPFLNPLSRRGLWCFFFSVRATMDHGCNTQHAIRNTQHATCNTQHATRNTQHDATRNTQHATSNTQQATRNTQHATRNTVHTVCTVVYPLLSPFFPTWGLKGEGGYIKQKGVFSIGYREERWVIALQLPLLHKKDRSYFT